MAGYITEKQEEILNFIKDQILKKGYPPAVREICEAVHLEVYVVGTLSPGVAGEERIYPQGPYEAPCD